MSSEKKSYSIDELRELKALSNSNVEIIGNIKFEPTHGYVAAPSRHSSVKKGAETDSSGGVSLVDSLKTSFTNWADDDDEEEENYWHEDDEDEEIIPIEHIQNRWIPPSVRRKLVPEDDADTDTGDEPPTNTVVAKAKSTLNKLTVERFEKLSNVFANIVYENENYVNEIAEVIVFKAKAESHFASLYANLCVFICGVEDLSALGTSNLSEGRDAKRAAVTAFKRALLEHCQNQMNIVPEEKNDVEYFKNPSPKKKTGKEEDDNDNEDEHLDKIALERKHYYGLVMFVGHLYKTKFLPCFIVHSIISKFLEGKPFVYGSVRPFFLVATCKLLHIAGKRLECGDEELTKISDRTGNIGFDMEDEIEKQDDFNRKWLTFYMEVFNVLLEKHEMMKAKMGGSETTDANDSADDDAVVYAPRVIFALRDIVELRQSNWEPRRMNLKAKSLEQIKADRDAEEARRKAELLASKLALKEQALHGRELDTDGFETVVVGGRRGRNEGRRQAKAKESRINQAIARGRYRNKGNHNNGKPPRYNNNNNRNRNRKPKKTNSPRRNNNNSNSDGADKNQQE